MSTKTNLWTDKHGKKIPIQMLEDSYLKSVYKLCWIVVYYYQQQKKEVAKVEAWLQRKYIEYNVTTVDEVLACTLQASWGITMPLKTAEKFSILFEEEILRRGKKWKRPNYYLLDNYLKQRDDSNTYLRSRFNYITKNS